MLKVNLLRVVWACITEEADEGFENELLEFLNGNNHGKVWERRSL
jgi:hypothetical protein